MRRALSGKILPLVEMTNGRNDYIEN